MLQTLSQPFPRQLPIPLCSHMPQASVFKGVQGCHLPAPKRSKPFRSPFPRNCQHPSAATCPRHLFLTAFKAAVCSPRTAFSQATANTSRSHMPQPSVFKGVQGCRLPAPKCSKCSRSPFPGNCRYPYAATCLSHLFLRAFKAAVCPPPNAPNPPACTSLR